MSISIETVREHLKEVQHPGKNDNIVNLGMVQRVALKDNKLEVNISFEKATDPFMGSIEKNCKAVLAKLVGSEYQVLVGTSVAKPQAPPKPETKPLNNIKNIVAVSSGKGGVGKSTIATNLAIALAIDGYKTAILDADIFGPSIPKMFALENHKPDTTEKDGKEWIVPAEKYGVKVLSVGFFVDGNNALVWRGPMASGALKQLLLETDWGELDYLIIDTPPGTSDIHLTLVQTIAVTGAVIVTTPQQVALADARKGIQMFTSKGINVPVLGLVENMSWFTPAELPENKYYIFGKDGGKHLAEEMNIPLLAEIPLVQSICESGDSGQPGTSLSHGMLGEAFRNMAANVVQQVEYRNMNIEPTKIVEITNK